MSLRPLAHYLKTPLGTTTSSDLTDVRLTVRSVETVVLGTGTLTQTVAVVAANEVRPLTDVTIQVTNGQFLSDATLTVASAYHRHADLITFDYTPSDIPAGRSIFIVDDRNATTLATITNASSGLLRLSLDATTNTWIVTETIDSTDTNPTFGTVSVTGTIRNANGTTLLPSYTFSSDTTAGMLYAGSGGVKIATSGLQSVLFSGVDQSATFSGNIIGTGALNAINVASGVTPFTELEVDSTSSSSPRGIMTAQFSTDNGGARLHMRKARGTRATPTTVVTGDNLGRLVGTGYDGANYLEMASIYFASEGTIAATRIPTNIQFWTATNATPSVLTMAGQFNSSQQLLVTNGTAAAPSYSFTANTDRGFYNGTNAVNLSIGGAQILTFDVAGTIQGFGNKGFLLLNSSGAASLSAAGTNQSITLSPSGSGIVNLVGAAANNAEIDLSPTGATTVMKIYAGSGDGGIDVTNSKNLNFRVGASGTTSAMFLTNTQHLLLGGLTTDGTGVLQFPAATAAAGGITFGTDANLFRTAAGHLALAHAGGTNPAFELWESTTVKGYFQDSAGVITLGTNSGNLVLQTATTTALTLDSSQNATFAAAVKLTGSGGYGVNNQAGSSQGLTNSGNNTVVNSNGSATSVILQSSTGQEEFRTVGGGFVSYHGAPAAANTVTQLVKAVTAIANNTATDILTVTVPNAAHSARLRVSIVGSLGAGGAIGANEATGTTTYDIPITRTAGVATVPATPTPYGVTNTNVAGGATITVTASISAISGAVSATQTFTVQVTIARGSGSSTNHTAQVLAEIINANATGITIA